MDSVEVSTRVYLPPAEVYAFLLDFERYAGYSEYLRTVRAFGEGGAGTEYELEFAWWKLQYTARSAVVDVDPPNRIEWQLTKDIDAAGRWLVEPIDAAEQSPATEVTFVVEYAPGSATDGILDLPRFVSLEWVVDRIEPKIRTEAERIVRRVVADLEGAERDVGLRIDT